MKKKVTVVINTAVCIEFQCLKNIIAQVANARDAEVVSGVK